MLIRSTDTVDHLRRRVEQLRADVVGVSVQPAHRGGGVANAQAFYRRFGFRPTGVTTADPTGLELGFAIELTNRRADP